MVTTFFEKFCRPSDGRLGRLKAAARVPLLACPVVLLPPAYGNRFPSKRLLAIEPGGRRATTYDNAALSDVR